MIEIRACTPDDAAAVTTLLSDLGYTVPIRQATENIQELGKTGADPIFVAVRGRSGSWASRNTPVSNVAIRKSGCARYGLSG